MAPARLWREKQTTNGMSFRLLDDHIEGGEIPFEKTINFINAQLYTLTNHSLKGIPRRPTLSE